MRLVCIEISGNSSLGDSHSGQFADSEDIDFLEFCQSATLAPTHYVAFLLMHVSYIVGMGAKK